MSNKNFLNPTVEKLDQIYEDMYDLASICPEDMTNYQRVVVARMLKIGYDYMLNNPGQEFSAPEDLLWYYDRC